MDAPVNFKRTGIERLILDNANTSPDLVYAMDADELLLSSAFRMPVWGRRSTTNRVSNWGAGS